MKKENKILIFLIAIIEVITIAIIILLFFISKNSKYTEEVLFVDTEKAVIELPVSKLEKIGIDKKNRKIEIEYGKNSITITKKK